MRALSAEPVNGRWLLTGLVGRGSTATVYRGFDLVAERLVAVKTLGAPRHGGGPCRQARREFQALARLRHPNLVRTYDLALSESGPLPAGSAFFTMELLEEASLGSSHEAADPQRIGRTALGLLAALSCIHVNGLVHNDVKPSNVLLERRGRDEARVKLSDLGLASSSPRPATKAGRVRGTLHYAAPEVLAGGRVDARSDLYSLGVLLFEAATGTLPFDDRDPATVLQWHLRGSRSLPRAAQPLSPVLSRVIARLLEVRPEARYARARDAWEEVAEAWPDSGTAPVHEEDGCEAPLTGRCLERRRLVEWLDDRVHTGGLLRITGARGSGRSRLAREASNFGRSEGWFVHAWECREGDLPFSPFSLPLRETILTACRGAKRECAPTGGEILALLGGPALWSAPGRVFEEARIPLARSLAAFLATAARSRPLLMVLDDLDRADAGSRLAVQCLCGEIERARARVLVVTTVLDDSRPRIPAQDSSRGAVASRSRRVGQALASPRPGPRAEDLRLAPLATGGARKLIESLPCFEPLRPRETDALVRDAAGLPGRLVRLAHARAGRQRLLF